MSNAVKWKNDLSGEFEDCRPLAPNMASNFIPIVPTTLIGGGYKRDQLLSDPSQSFYAALIRHVHQADAIICAGYGFGDAHVNRALQNRFILSHYDSRGRPPVVVLTKTPPQSGLIGDRQGYDFYARELTHSINTRFPSSGGKPGPELPLNQLIDQNRFETDYFKRSAVWHGGFVEARDHVQTIIAWLKQ